MAFFLVERIMLQRKPFGLPFPVLKYSVNTIRAKRLEPRGFESLCFILVWQSNYLLEAEQVGMIQKEMDGSL